jgi:hypothetical protein
MIGYCLTGSCIYVLTIVDRQIFTALLKLAVSERQISHLLDAVIALRCFLLVWTQPRKEPSTREVVR